MRRPLIALVILAAAAVLAVGLYTGLALAGSTTMHAPGGL